MTTNETQPNDPFDALRIVDEPLAPRASFADDLRQHLINELGATMSTDTTTTRTRSAGAPPVTTVTAVTPYLIVRNGVAALDFYRDAFGAVEELRFLGDDGRVGHAEFRLGTSRMMLADEHPEHGIVGPESRGGATCSFSIDVADVDAAYRTAVAAGATSEREPADQFHGNRNATVVDPFGHRWMLTAPTATLSTDEYVAAAADQGYVVELADSTPDGADQAADKQIKHYDRGDLYYFTIPVADLTKAQTFFSAVLGWEFGEPQAGHVSNIAAPPGGVRAGAEMPGTQLWFVVDDIHAAVARVREMGGSAEEPVDYESGWSAECIDDQGTAFNLSVPADKYRR